jgi:hypothetical protein
MPASFAEFEGKIFEFNKDFKENVLKHAQLVKLHDTEALNKKVDEVKQQEA